MAAEFPKPPTLVAGGIVTGVALLVALAIIALAQYVGFGMQDELERKVLARPNPQLMALRAREGQLLSRYQWVDRKQGIVRIPVERALELTLRDWKQGAEQQP